MIRKVLIAEDQESASLAVQRTMEELGITIVDYVYYCDDALLRIRKAKDENDPYDLLITDLYFEKDYRQQDLADGFGLISAARESQPDLKVLVFSAEDKAARVDELYKKLTIDGFVRKARNDARELKSAIELIGRGQQYKPRNSQNHFQQKNTHIFTSFDITIINLLAQGMPQKNIPDLLKREGIKPSSLSSIEKRLNHIKTALDCTKNEQLVAFCKDLGII